MAEKHKPNDHYKIVYFPFYGRAEVLRFILAYGGIKPEEEVIEWDDWPKKKPELPFPSMPLLVLDHGKQWIGQHLAQARYLAKQFGLQGKSIFDQAQVDMYADGCNDLWYGPMQEWEMIYFGYEGADKEEKLKAAGETFVKEGMIPWLERYRKFIEANKSNSGWLVGEKESFADFYTAIVAHNMTKFFEYDVGKNYPKIKALIDKVHSFPGIAKHLKERPVRAF